MKSRLEVVTGEIPAQEKDGLIVLTHPVSKAEKAFKRLLQAIAHGDPLADDAAGVMSGIVMVGETEDRNITVLRSFLGYANEIRKKAIEWKDTFFAKRIYAPLVPPGQWEKLCREPGLQQYPFTGYDVFNRKKYDHNPPKDYWPSFRDWDCKAVVCPYSERFSHDLTAAIDTVEEMIDRLEVGFDTLFVPGLEQARQKLQIKRQENREYLAMVAAVWHMADTRPRQAVESNSEPLWRPFYDRH